VKHKNKCLWPYFIIVGLTALLIREITKDWGWNRDWKKKDIPELPSVSGAYVLYSRSEKVIHVGSTGNLWDSISKHEKKVIVYSFDWIETGTAEEAYELEMKLQVELGI